MSEAILENRKEGAWLTRLHCSRFMYRHLGVRFSVICFQQRKGYINFLKGGGGGGEFLDKIFTTLFVGNITRQQKQ